MQLFITNIKKSKIIMATFILMLGIIGFFIIRQQVEFLSVTDITSTAQVAIKGDNISVYDNDPTIASDGIYFDRFANYSLNSKNNIDGVGFYLYFKLDDLAPLTNYKITLSMNLKDNVSSNGKVQMFMTSVAPDSTYNAQLEQYTTNVSLTDEQITSNLGVSYNVLDSKEDYNATLTFTSNYEGDAWFVVGQEKLAGEDVNFDISKLRYDIEAVAYDN